MKIAINLASQPFRRDRKMIVASLAVCVLLLITLGGLIRLATQDNEQLADVRREVSLLKQQIQTIATQQAQLDAVIHKPDNETVLERSAFINTLLLRKGVSWNQIFTDLEKTLPYNVKLVRIRPTVNEQGHVVLDMTLASDGPEPAAGAFRKFEDNPLFGATEWKSITPPSQSEPMFRVALNVTYAQKL